MIRPPDAPDSLREKDFEIDLGNDHWAMFYGHGGEGIMRNGQPVPYTPKVGLVITHRTPTTETGWCQGAADFDVPALREAWAGHPGHPMWTVYSLDPLDMSPSFRCGCGDHGFIRQGKWVGA